MPSSSPPTSSPAPGELLANSYNEHGLYISQYTRDNITRDIFMWWNLFQEMHNCGGQWAVLQRWCREQRRLIVTTVCSARSVLGEKGWKSDLEWNANFKKSTHPRQPWFITKLKETVEWFQTDRCSGRVRRGWSNIYVWLPTDRRENIIWYQY